LICFSGKYSQLRVRGQVWRRKPKRMMKRFPPSYSYLMLSYSQALSVAWSNFELLFRMVETLVNIDFYRLYALNTFLTCHCCTGGLLKTTYFSLLCSRLLMLSCYEVAGLCQEEKINETFGEWASKHYDIHGARVLSWCRTMLLIRVRWWKVGPSMVGKWVL
jgi:hypothetical protein